MELIMNNNYFKYHLRFLLLFAQGICFYDIDEENEFIVTDYLKFLDLPFYSVSFYG